MDGRGAVPGQRSVFARKRGARGGENVGMSSERRARIPPVESPRVPGEGLSAQGQSGPKPEPKGAGDGQQAEIPALEARIKRRGDAEGQRDPADGRAGPSGEAGGGGKSPPPLRLGRDGERKRSREARAFTPPGKAPSARACTRTANRHRWAGRASRDEREKCCQGTRQNDPVTSGEGVPGISRAAEKRLKRLFSKNTGLCQIGR